MSKFAPTKNRTSLISNEVMEINRYNLKLKSQQLLFGLAQSIDHTIDMFGDIEFDIHGIFKFLDIENRNDRYEVVRDALFDITENPLQKRKNIKQWSSIPWMSVEYDEEVSTFVKIHFDDKVKPFLLAMSQYTTIKGLYISKLSSQYATWLYPIMKMIQSKYKGNHPLTIIRLKEYTFTDNPKEHPAYNTSINANNNFLRKVLGIIWNPKAKRCEILEGSPLYEINQKTDINVSVELIKDGKKYVEVKFHVVSKYTKANQIKEIEKSKFVKSIPKEGITSTIRIKIAQIYEYANASKMTVQEYCEKANYRLDGAYAYKKWTKEQYDEMIKVRDLKNNPRTYRQMTIGDIIDKEK